MAVFNSYVSLPEGIIIYIYYDAKLPVHDIHNSTFLASGVESAQFQQKTDTRCNKSNQLVLHAFQVKHIISTILVSWYNSHPYHNTCEVYLYHWLYIYIYYIWLVYSIYLIYFTLFISYVNSWDSFLEGDSTQRAPWRNHGNNGTSTGKPGVLPGKT